MAPLTRLEEVAPQALPPGALLHRYAEQGAFTDCHAVTLGRPVALAALIGAFYGSRVFRAERLVLRLLAGRPSSNADVQRLARGDTPRFAAWTVEDRTPTQILLADDTGRTRSWLMVAPHPHGTTLYFGSALIPRVDRRTGQRRTGPLFRPLLGFHTAYSRALLRAAAQGLAALPVLPGTSGLVFESIAPAHADELFEAFSDPSLYTYIPQRPPPSVAALRADFARYAAGPAAGSGERWWNWVVRCAGSRQALGTLQATRLAHGALWVGYTIAAPYRGRGIATSGLRWVLQQLAAEYPGMPVQASVDTRHVASLRVLHKCGFEVVRTEDAELHGVATRDLIHVFVLPGGDLSSAP